MSKPNQESLEPRLYQKEVLDRLKTEQKIPPIVWPPRRFSKPFVAIDTGQKDGDSSVIVRGVPNRKGGFSIISIDEYATWPEYKWYRNPIKWYKWRKLMKGIRQRKFEGQWLLPARKEKQ